MATNQEKIEALNFALNAIDALEDMEIKEAIQSDNLRLATMEEFEQVQKEGSGSRYQKQKEKLLEMLEELQDEELKK